MVVVSVGGLVVVSWRGCCFVDVVRGFDFRPPAVLAHEIFTGRLERFSSAYKRALPPVPDIAYGIVRTHRTCIVRCRMRARSTEFLHCISMRSLSYPTGPPSAWLLHIYEDIHFQTPSQMEGSEMAPKATIINRLGKRRRSPPLSGRGT